MPPAMSTPFYHPVPQPEEIPIREREDAMGAYLMMFAAIGAGLPLPVINLIASIVYYFINRSHSRFVHFHSLQAMLSQMPTSIMNIILVFWSVRIFFTDATVNDYYVGYIWLTVIANILYFVYGIISAVKARRGRMYYLMFFGKISYSIAFAVKEEKTREIKNEPPPIG
ncbi:MAG: DUF4870 domain-containing protein [Bacteroidetes bacterium]|nr:DUF4870 domain-containing protein [Bacteroidota bacterium]